MSSLVSPPRPSLAQIGIGIVICEAAGILGTVFTRSALQNWYPALQKPDWTPPSWVFGPVWTVLYALMGCALAWLWASPAGSSNRAWSLRWFWIQLVLNVAWSLTFFGLRAPAAGYCIILMLWLAIIGLLWTASKTARPTLWLLLPYFLWVTFASTLNFGILSFNVLKPKVQAMDANPKNQNRRWLVKPEGTPVPPIELE
jgi:translocator protein